MMFRQLYYGIVSLSIGDTITDGEKPIPKYKTGYLDGDVYCPDINFMEEMTNLVQAAIRSYGENVLATQATRDMALSALEIGR